MRYILLIALLTIAPSVTFAETLADLNPPTSPGPVSGVAYPDVLGGNGGYTACNMPYDIYQFLEIGPQNNPIQQPDYTCYIVKFWPDTGNLAWFFTTRGGGTLCQWNTNVAGGGPDASKMAGFSGWGPQAGNSTRVRQLNAAAFNPCQMDIRPFLHSDPVIVPRKKCPTGTCPGTGP